MARYLLISHGGGRRAADGRAAVGGRALYPRGPLYRLVAALYNGCTHKLPPPAKGILPSSHQTPAAYVEDWRDWALQQLRS